MGQATIDKPILVLVAMEEELQAFIRHLNFMGEHHNDITGAIEVSLGKKKPQLKIASVGMGPYASSVRTLNLIKVYDPAYVILVGCSGALDNGMELCDIFQIRNAVRYREDKNEHAYYEAAKLPLKALSPLADAVKITDVATVGKFIEGEEAKKHLHRATNCSLVDMETYAVLRVCDKMQIPCSVLRSVSDKLACSEQDFYSNLANSMKSLALLVNNLNLNACLK